MPLTAQQLAIYLRELHDHVIESYDQALLSGDLTEEQYARGVPFTRGMEAIIEVAERRTGLRPAEEDDPDPAWSSWNIAE